MKFNVVEKTEFGSAGRFLRLDAEFVDPDLLAAEQKLRKREGWHLNELVQKAPKTSFAEPADPEQFVRYVPIDAVDTADGLTFPDDLKYEDLPSRAKYLVAEGDILVSNVRPNRGNVCLVGKRIAGCLASSGFTLVRLPASPQVTNEFTFAFLKSEHAKNQLVRRNRGSMYPAVVGDDVHDLWVPKPSKELDRDIVRIVQGALAAQERFYTLHGAMTKRLEAFLKPYGAPPSPLEGRVGGVDCTVVRSSDVFGPTGACRIDAEFFRVEYVQFDKHVQKLGKSFLLGDYFELNPGRTLGDGDDETPYIKQAVLTNVGINWSAVAYEPGSPGPIVGRVKSGDILLACTAHEIYYVGRKVDFVRSVPTEISDNNTCVPDLMIVRPRGNKPKHLHCSYVAAYLRHPAGLHQTQRCIRGLRGGHVYKDDLSKYVRVPIPSDKWLDEFEELAESMEAARNDAKATMRTAFDKIDAFIATVS